MCPEQCQRSSAAVAACSVEPQFARRAVQSGCHHDHNPRQQHRHCCRQCRPSCCAVGCMHQRCPDAQREVPALQVVWGHWWKTCVAHLVAQALWRDRQRQVGNRQAQPSCMRAQLPHMRAQPWRLQAKEVHRPYTLRPGSQGACLAPPFHLHPAHAATAAGAALKQLAVHQLPLPQQPLHQPWPGQHPPPQAAEGARALQAWPCAHQRLQLRTLWPEGQEKRPCMLHRVPLKARQAPCRGSAHLRCFGKSQEISCRWHQALHCVQHWAEYLAHFPVQSARVCLWLEQRWRLCYSRHQDHGQCKLPQLRCCWHCDDRRHQDAWHGQLCSHPCLDRLQRPGKQQPLEQPPALEQPPTQQPLTRGTAVGCAARRLPCQTLTGVALDSARGCCGVRSLDLLAGAAPATSAWSRRTSLALQTGAGPVTG
jgi:hypothetical protein